MNSLVHDREHLVEQFQALGFLVIENALSDDQLSALNAAVHRYLENYRDEWIQLNDFTIEIENVLPNVSDFDVVIENPKVLDILRGIIGDNITFEQFSFMIRNPTDTATAFRGWHRDLTRDYRRRKEIEAISTIYYLTDVTEHDSCFSIIPESHDRLIDLDPANVRPEAGFDVTGAAGTAVIFHARCIHAGRLKPRSQQRRSLHVYYSHCGVPRTAQWSDIPERLYKKIDPALPSAFYSKWNETDVFDGTGKIPEDIDRSMSMPDIVKEVQKRANKRTV